MAPSTIAVLNGTSRVNQHIIQQALAKGQRVRAIVRSTSRFYAQAKKHDDLEAHEWSDFTDLTTLASILDGVDVVYVALCAPADKIHEPSWLNASGVASICTVLHDGVSPGGRSATKVVLLAAFGTIPGVPRHAVGEAILGHQFNDLRASQEYLRKQEGWLDVLYVMPGVILDSESSADVASVAAVELREGTEVQPGPISYARLAAAMQDAAADGRWTGKYAVPIPTAPPVPRGVKHFAPAFQVIMAVTRNKLVPAVGKVVAFLTLGTALGYVVGSRDGGAWALRTLGVNVKSFR